MNTINQTLVYKQRKNVVILNKALEGKKNE